MMPECPFQQRTGDGYIGNLRTGKMRVTPTLKEVLAGLSFLTWSADDLIIHAPADAESGRITRSDGLN